MKHRIATILLVAGIVLAYLLSSTLLIFTIISIVLFLIFSAVLIAGVSIIRWNYFIPSINRVEKGKIALTFDDGPNEFTLRILDILDNHNTKATFFLIGHKCEKHPEIVKKIYEKGHTIGNHSYSHTNNLGWAGKSKMENEINKTNQLIESLTEEKPKFFRPPFGVTNPNIALAVKKTGMKSIGWSIRSYDTMAKSAESLIQKVLPQINNNGHIVLMHEHGQHTPVLLEELINACKSKGIEIVNLDQEIH